MGNAVRKNRAKGKIESPTQPSGSNPLEERLTAVIKEKAIAANGKPVKFNRLLLKFPTLYTGFAKCKDVFEELDINKDGGLQLQELRLGCAKLGYMLTDEEVDRFFAATDINCNESLDVKEFIVVLAIMHALEGVGNRDSVDPDIERTFKTAEEAFLCFDSSKDGYIDKEELLKLLQEGSTADKSRSGEPSTMQSVIAQRFDELDTDGDGRISLVEFLFCLSNWVIDAEDDEGILTV